MSDVRSSLVAAARELFSSQGYTKTTIQQLADRAGISKGAVYLHFRSKSDVMVALQMEIEASVLAAVARIAERDDLSPIEKLRAQLRYHFADLHEHLQLFEAYLLEAGVEIDEELTLRAQKMRVDWLRVQEEFLSLAYPDHDRRHTTDLAVTLNGALNEYYSYALLEGAALDADRVADYLVAMAGAMVRRLDEGDLLPVLDRKSLPPLEEIESKMARALEQRIEASLAEIDDYAESTGGEEGSEIRETLEALRKVLSEAEPSRAVLQGLLANLRDVKELAPQRRSLARELGLKLV
ncbi:MAG TPA: helix-turn-helix domain-containing protein [Thermoanaerobaculia bacterium]|nr:helix-turn-helix domain-containing protein [Thermoanaerobaculia bacterium]